MLLGAVTGSAEVSPYAAASRAVDLAGLPPSFIAVGTLDLFVDENIDYAKRFIRAGVLVELHVYSDAVHGFQIAQEARVSIAAQTHSRAAPRRAFHG